MHSPGSRYFTHPGVAHVIYAVRNPAGVEQSGSKSDVAMVTETLCKFLCHNHCVLNHEQFELGIEAEFWKDRSRAAGTALQLPGASEALKRREVPMVGLFLVLLTWEYNVAHQRIETLELIRAHNGNPEVESSPLAHREPKFWPATARSIFGDAPIKRLWLGDYARHDDTAYRRVAELFPEAGKPLYGRWVP